MQVACLRCLPARKPLRRFSTLRRFPPFLPCRTPVRSISDTHPVDIGHRSGPNRTPFRSHRKTVRHQSGRLSDFNRNTVRFESERCPTSNRIGVRFASEYAQTQGISSSSSRTIPMETNGSRLSAGGVWCPARWRCWRPRTLRRFASSRPSARRCLPPSTTYQRLKPSAGRRAFDDRAVPPCGVSMGCDDASRCSRSFDSDSAVMPRGRNPLMGWAGVDRGPTRQGKESRPCLSVESSAKTVEPQFETRA